MFSFSQNGAALTRSCSITFSFVALPCETPKSVKPLTVSRAFSTFWLCTKVPFPDVYKRQVFTLDKAREVSAAAVKAGRVQFVLLKVYSDDDFLYPGQESGFVQHSLHEVVAEIKKLPGLHLAGLTPVSYTHLDVYKRQAGVA